MTVAKLGVDAENPTGALKLYESTGFTKYNTYVLYSLDISGDGQQRTDDSDTYYRRSSVVRRPPSFLAYLLLALL